MKKINTIFWIATGLFGAFMMFSAIPDILCVPDAVTFMTHLGYPVYFIQLISYAKLVGCAVILIPGINRSVKEWAYAGLFFDLGGAIYSGIASSGKFDPMMLTMLGWILPGVISYYCWHKRIKA